MKIHFLMIERKPLRCPECGSKDERYRRDLAVGGPTCDHDWHYPEGRPAPDLRPSRFDGPSAQFIDTSFEATQRRLGRLA